MEIKHKNQSDNNLEEVIDLFEIDYVYENKAIKYGRAGSMRSRFHSDWVTCGDCDYCHTCVDAATGSG